MCAQSQSDKRAVTEVSAAWVVSGCQEWVTQTKEGMKLVNDWQQIFSCHVCLTCTACALWAFLEDSHQGRNASIDFRVMSCTACVGKGEGSWEEGLVLRVTPTVTALRAQMGFSLIPSVMRGHSFSS